MKTLLAILLSIMDGIDWLHDLKPVEGWQDSATETFHLGEGFDK